MTQHKTGSDLSRDPRSTSERERESMRREEKKKKKPRERNSRRERKEREERKRENLSKEQKKKKERKKNLNKRGERINKILVLFISLAKILKYNSSLHLGVLHCVWLHFGILVALFFFFLRNKFTQGGGK